MEAPPNLLHVTCPSFWDSAGWEAETFLTMKAFLLEQALNDLIASQRPLESLAFSLHPNPYVTLQGTQTLQDILFNSSRNSCAVVRTMTSQKLVEVDYT